MTPKQQKIAQRNARHQRQVARRLEKKKARAMQANMPDEEEIEEEDDLEETDGAEEETGESGDIIASAVASEASDEPEEAPSIPVKKDYGEMAMPDMSMGGPISFDELDEQRTAQEQASQVRDTTYDVHDLVRNIMSNQMLDTAEKSSAIQKVGKDFGTRVNSIMSGDVPTDTEDGDMGDMQKSRDDDLDLLYAEAVIESDRRHLSFHDQMSDWWTIEKAALSYGAKKAKPDSAYALVYTDKSGNKVRKYLIHDKAHVRNALARAAQQIKGGGAGAGDARRALGKIHAAAKRMGIGMGKSNDSNAIILEKDANGNWRWVGWASNNFKDLQEDIVSQVAHEEYVDFLQKNADMHPLFCTWHIPGTERKNPVDTALFEKGFLILSGKLEAQEAAGLLRAQAQTDLGMSIKGLGLREDKDPRVITKYRLVEVSDLPLENAANPFTAFAVLTKGQEDDMDNLKYLAAILGSEEKAKAFIAKTGMQQEALAKAGVEQKDKDSKPIEPATPASVLPVTPKAPANASPDVQAVVAQVIKELGMDELSAAFAKLQEQASKVPLLEEVIKDMQGNADQKLAEKITPPAARYAWMSKERASESEKTVVKPDDPLAQRVPGLGDDWLSKVTNTVPIDTSAVPMQ